MQAKGRPAPPPTGAPTARQSAVVIVEAEKDDFLRRALPWMAALTFVAILLAMSTVVIVENAEGVLPPGPVEVALEAGTLPADEESRTQPGSPASTGLAMPLPPALSGVLPDRPVATADIRPRMQPVVGRTGTAGLSEPSPDEVLEDLPAAALQQPEGQVGWEQGAARRILLRRDPQFPRVLGASGVEVECTARITVSPSGAVTHVEITRSSGYTEIDANVEAALREFLFSQVDGRKDAVGTITFRFRLEKQD